MLTLIGFAVAVDAKRDSNDDCGVYIALCVVDVSYILLAAALWT